tara:strand:+ start:128 stop:508 length:381 start_codon:yes stop_codon:yes gene_type:complete
LLRTLDFFALVGKMGSAWQGTILAFTFNTTGDVMKTKCKNPNGKSNMQMIADSKIKPLKFNSFDKLERYINELGYTFNGQNCFKEDRSIVYRHMSNKKKHLFVKSTYDFLNDTTMEMGTVWVVSKL